MTTNTWEHNEYLVNKWNGILDYCSDTMAAVYGYAERVNVAKLLENAECEYLYPTIDSEYRKHHKEFVEIMGNIRRIHMGTLIQ